MAALVLLLVFLVLSLGGVAFHGRVQEVNGDMKISVKNMLANPVFVSVKNSQGITAKPVTLIVDPDVRRKSLLLAHSSTSYETQRPWFMWLRITAVAPDLHSFEWRQFGFLVEDPHYGKNRTMGCGSLWQIHGNGIFLALIDCHAKTLLTTQFCSWNRSSVPHLLDTTGVEPFEYKTRSPVQPCSSYMTSWMQNPVWISVSHNLVTDVEVRIKKGNEISVIHLDRNGMQGKNTPRKYERILSASAEEFRKHVWTIVVRVKDDLRRNFDVTLHNPLGLQLGKSVIGCILELDELFIWVVQVYANWQKGDAKAVCSWLEEESSAGVPYCGHGDGFRI